MNLNLGPAVLGRGVILESRQEVPVELADAPVFDVDQATLTSAQSTADAMHRLWARREPFVVRLHVSPNDLKLAAREIDKRAPYKVGAEFLFHVQRLHFLVWNNNWDLRSGEPIWWWTNKATALGASVAAGEGDIFIDGVDVYCDGGPMQPLDVLTVPYVAIQNGSLRMLRNRASSSELAEDQSAAVHHAGGSARIIAPAGSGKTRVLTERLRHVLNDWNVMPGAVCAVAYNTRAAAELNERTSDLSANIRTLNSLALAIVSGTSGFATSELETRRRDTIGERDIRSILQNLVEVPRRTNSDPFAAWIEALSEVRLGLVAPEAVEEDSGDLSDFAMVFDRYREHLHDHALLDFDEQIYRAIEILLRDPVARQVAQKQCRMLLVDEFQDLTPAHMLLLRLLAMPALDVFGVGDDDQVIYGYAGADPRYLVKFEEWFPGAQSHPLEINYRCPPSVVQAASNMLTRNGLRVAKNISARPGRETKENELEVEHHGAPKLATRAIELITGYLGEGVAATDIALLTRVNVTLLPVQVMLTELGIPHTAPVDAALLKRTGIRTALAYLRMGANPDAITRADIIDTVRRPSRKIARNVTDMMTKRSRSSLQDLRSVAASLSGSDGPKLDEYIQDIALVATAVESKTTTEALDLIQNRIGLGEVLNALDSSRNEADRSTHADDLAALSAVAHLHSDASTFEHWLNEILSRNHEGVGVELSTVHRVKGREWDHVISYDVSEGLMPHRLASDRSEERRVLHVSLTRARNKAVVLANKATPSPFLGELAAPGEPEVFRRSTRESRVVDVDAPPKRDSATNRTFELLKLWRKHTAEELSVPAFTVFHDSHLESMAVRRPTTLAMLAKCRGIGETKLDRWGDELLAVIETAIESTEVKL